METTRLSSKGQVVIPKAIRDGHHWQAGTEFVVEECADGILLKPGERFARTSVEAGIGCAGYKGPSKTLEEIEQGLAAAVRGTWRPKGTR